MSDPVPIEQDQELDPGLSASEILNSPGLVIFPFSPSTQPSNNFQKQVQEQVKEEQKISLISEEEETKDVQKPKHTL